MARATPSEIRWKVIILWKLFNYTVPQTCKTLGLTRASVYNFRKLYNDTGRVDVNAVRRGRMPKLNEAEATALVEHMKEDPSQHSTDFQDWFFRKFGKKLSKSTIGRYLHTNGYRKGKQRKRWVQVDVSKNESKTDFLKDVAKPDFKGCFENVVNINNVITDMAPAASDASDESGSSSSSQGTTPLQDQSYHPHTFNFENAQSPMNDESMSLDTTMATTALQHLLQHNPLSSLSTTSALTVKLELKDGKADFAKYFDDFVAATCSSSGLTSTFSGIGHQTEHPVRP
ncbi:uncharacterized protein LOC134191470 isoform X2 [Corticium candelabrum]|nr:uncharacterized protein LOC134191470 isoform X2 [Corticium candelabrum]